MAPPTPTELRQQFLLEFTRAVIETMAARPEMHEIPQPQEEEFIPSIHPQEMVFPVVQVPTQNSFTIPSQIPVKASAGPKLPVTTPSPLRTILEDSSINAIEC